MALINILVFALQQGNVKKNPEKSLKVLNIEGKNFHIFWTTWRISGFTLKNGVLASLQSTFFEKPQGGSNWLPPPPPPFPLLRVKIKPYLALLNKVFILSNVWSVLITLFSLISATGLSHLDRNKCLSLISASR